MTDFLLGLTLWVSWFLISLFTEDTAAYDALLVYLRHRD